MLVSMTQRSMVVVQDCAYDGPFALRVRCSWRQSWMMRFTTCGFTPSGLARLRPKASMVAHSCCCTERRKSSRKSSLFVRPSSFAKRSASFSIEEGSVMETFFTVRMMIFDNTWYLRRFQYSGGGEDVNSDRKSTR